MKSGPKKNVVCKIAKCKPSRQERLGEVDMKVSIISFTNFNAQFFIH